jgi:hypothetical protein
MIERVPAKQLFSYTTVANIHVRLYEALGHTLEPLQIPVRVARRAKQNAALLFPAPMTSRNLLPVRSKPETGFSQ